MNILVLLITTSLIAATVGSMEAWRIRISTRDRQLSLSQVLIFDVNNVNNAVNKSCIAVTGQPWDAPRGTSQCEWAIDGNLEAKGENPNENGYYYESASSTGVNWWEIHLDTNISVSSVKIINRADCCQENLLGATLELYSSLSDTPAFSTTLKSSDSPSTNYSVTVEIPVVVDKLEASSTVLVILILMFVCFIVSVVVLGVYVQCRRMKDMREAKASSRIMLSDDSDSGPTELTAVLQ